MHCTGQDLRISFTDQEGYDFARRAWRDETNFILSTYAEGCGTLKDQRTFWLIDHLTFGSDCNTCVTAVAQYEINPKDALRDVDVTWGTYTPNVVAKAKRALRDKRQVVASSKSTGDCGKAPSDKIDGFPSATCNSSTFDQDLDDKIGYLSFGEDDYSGSLKSFAPGLGDYAAEDNEGFGTLRRRFSYYDLDFLEFAKRVGQASSLLSRGSMTMLR